MKPSKSAKVKWLLKLHGAPGHPDSTRRGITVEDIDEMLGGLHDLSNHDVNFLKCCRETIGINTTVTKLVEAVQRQASFVNKMENQLWISSPAVQGTLCRAIDRYSKFIKLFKLYPKTMLVPMLDIDLVWHTHQCSPSRYDEGMLKMAGRLIDHDDKIGDALLGYGFTKTSNLFRIHFGQEYQVCNCWDCESLLSAVSSHILETEPDSEAIARHVQKEVAYYRAVEMARQNGNILLPVLS